MGAPTSNLRQVLLATSLLCTAPAVFGNWCTRTHATFNDQIVRLNSEEEPFRIGTLDDTGHTIGLVVNRQTSRYKYVRDVTIEGLVFREFRSDSMVFQLGSPGPHGSMPYKWFTKDARGVERGFAGVCAGA